MLTERIDDTKDVNDVGQPTLSKLMEALKLIDNIEESRPQDSKLSVTERFKLAVRF